MLISTVIRAIIEQNGEFPEKFPGTTVKVVNAYAPTSDFASVNAFKSVDLPELGNPIKITVPSPVFLTE